MKEKSINRTPVDDLGELLLGESKLQLYLKNQPIKPDSSLQNTQPELMEVRKHLAVALDRGNLKADHLQEADLLMAKLCYIEGEHSEALGHYDRVNLDELELVGAPVYRLSMIAEAYTTKGLCLEKIPEPPPFLLDASSPSTHLSPAAREQEIITCYEKSGDIALLYLQEAEKALSGSTHSHSPKPGPMTHDLELNYFLETGLQRAHVIYFNNGDLPRVVGRFREILRAVETRTTQNLRMTIARQLAEILLRGMCEQSYWSPLEDPPKVSPREDPPKVSTLGHPPKGSPVDDPTHRGARRASRVYCGENLFCPHNNTEEALLLLLISESMANQDAVLSRSPEDNDRITSLESASRVYDLLTIALGRRGQYKMLSRCLERTLKFAFEEFHLWYQFALSLMIAGKSARAVKILKQCVRLKPEDPTIPLLVVKLCIGPLHWLDEGEEYAKMVTDMIKIKGEFKAKGFLALGLVYSLKATDALAQNIQEEFQRKAMLTLQRAQRMYPNDPQISFYMALQLALTRMVPEGLVYVRQSLQEGGDNVHTLLLLVLLLSSMKQYDNALKTLEMALIEHPENFNLLYAKVKLDAMCRGPEEAILTCKRMLQIWKSTYNLTLPRISGLHSSLLDKAIRQFNTLTLADVSDPDDAASRLEQALSEEASPHGSGVPKHGPLDAWLTLAQIWLHAAEVYIGMKRPEEATACTQEAAHLFPTSHNTFYMRGQIAELRGNIAEAKTCYEEALCVCPTHAKSMQRLGVVLLQLESYSLAEKILRDGVRLDSTSHGMWRSLGEVLQAQGKATDAIDCFVSALDLEATSPVLPFTIIPRTL
ncbi:tetratricopeptide repeat protein 7B-like isoform X2 [Poeciliopsis prolifica]|uniref:tetratricopeptide repeat protein 7B-like isoform X2 n=1 Tax=Poeciliopsis prolifica TaxID=188132 RepID=UPI00241368BB|nr:tetratricopeptide repeat protein 7B-like isoform X2 [Poeciliopsis prolifica]